VNTTIGGLLAGLDARLAALPPPQAHLGTFLRTYRRTTAAVGQAVASGTFEDPDWVLRWTEAFGRFYTDALDAHLGHGPVPRPWRIAFGLGTDVHPLGHLLVGISTHINFDLPQAVLEVVSDADFADPVLLARRVRDHDRVDGVLASRVAAEDSALGGGRRPVDRLLTPVNRWASRRFLAESRHKVWQNVLVLQAARRAGPEVLDRRSAELEVLAAAKAVDVLTPGLVLPRLAVAGFGVRLPPD
jgi:hypothetical protein